MDCYGRICCDYRSDSYFWKTIDGYFYRNGGTGGFKYAYDEILAVGYIAMAITQSLSGIMRGAGDTMTPMWISLITTVAIRVPVAYGIAYLTRSELYPGGRCESVFVSLLVSWTLGAIITLICYRWGKWKQKAIEE